MKILLDECTPHVLKQRLPGFQITTVQELGWGGITNGKLLALATEQFDVFYHRQESQISTEPIRDANGNYRITD